MTTLPHVITLRLSDADLADLHTLAARTGKPASALMRAALGQYLDRELVIDIDQWELGERITVERSKRPGIVLTLRLENDEARALLAEAERAGEFATAYAKRVVLEGHV